jgi:hypothetical protein
MRWHRIINRKERTMRELTGHKINPANDVLTVTVVDQPGAGGAHHRYEISGFDATKNSSADLTDAEDMFTSKTILFQNGPIGEVGVNGITHEVLLAILIDRLECFENGKFANSWNAQALEHLRQAQGALLDRTRSRMDRGVEGTHTV